MNLRTDQIERIKDLGYTESEARFLYIVAIHSVISLWDNSELSPGHGTANVPLLLLKN